MSDEKYFQNLDENDVRHHSGPFFDPPETEDNLPRKTPLERLPLNIESIRKFIRERNPHD